MIFFGYVLALLMGMTLGLIGAGGSILAIPILVYFFEVPPVTATGYSLLLVGSTALFGGVRFLRQQQVHIPVTISFAIPSIIAVYATRRWLVPSLPDTFFSFAGITLTKDLFIMLLFATLMLIAAVLMIRSKPNLSPAKNANPKYRLLLICAEGTLVGVFTGIIGAGGGFLIIPALVLLAGLDMKRAVGSSLIIIALKSLLGFMGDLQTGIELNSQLLMIFLFCTLSGMMGGTMLARFIDGAKLKQGFGWFTLLVGITIILKEI